MALEAAVIGLTKSLSLHECWAATRDIEAARSAFIARQPIGRLGQPEEVAVVATLLASDEAAFITGSNIIVDCGMSL